MVDQQLNFHVTGVEVNMEEPEQAHATLINAGNGSAMMPSVRELERSNGVHEVAGVALVVERHHRPSRTRFLLGKAAVSFAGAYIGFFFCKGSPMERVSPATTQVFWACFSTSFVQKKR